MYIVLHVVAFPQLPLSFSVLCSTAATMFWLYASSARKRRKKEPILDNVACINSFHKSVHVMLDLPKTRWMDEMVQLVFIIIPGLPTTYYSNVCSEQ